MTPSEDRQEQKQIDLDAANARLAAMSLSTAKVSNATQFANGDAGAIGARASLIAPVRHCPNCGNTNIEWDLAIEEGVKVELSTLRGNQCVGAGPTGKHLLFTHRCPAGAPVPKAARAPRKDKGSKREPKLCDVCHQPIVFKKGATTSDCHHILRIIPKKAEPAQAQTQGALTKEQASRGLDLIATRDRLRVEWDQSVSASEIARERFEDYDAQVVAWFRENTAK